MDSRFRGNDIFILFFLKTLNIIFQGESATACFAGMTYLYFFLNLRTTDNEIISLEYNKGLLPLVVTIY